MSASAIASRHPRYTLATLALIFVSFLFIANQRSSRNDLPDYNDIKARIRSSKLYHSVKPSKEYLRRFIAMAEEQYQTSIQDRKNHIARWGGIDKLVPYVCHALGSFTCLMLLQVPQRWTLLYRLFVDCTSCMTLDTDCALL